MNSAEFLYKHAVKNVWCVPNQDINIILEPRRISPFGGSLVSQEVLWDEVFLPNNRDWFFVYQIGNVDPVTLGLDGTYNKWISAQTHSNRNNLLINAYTAKGRSYSMRGVFFIRNLDGNILVAVKQDNRIADLSHEKLYLRFYKNTFYGHPICPECDSGLVTWSGTVGSVMELSRVQVHFRKYKALQGGLTFMVNGLYVNDLTTATVQWGDEVQWVWDASIKDVVEYPLPTLQKFLSTRDTTDKYFLGRNGPGDDTIDYFDDNDIIIRRRINVGKTEGLYYHRNAAKAVRQVTHREYSIPVEYVDQLIRDNAWPVRDDAVVQLIVRHSGIRRPLIPEHHRIHELYKLPDTERYGAMAGTDATIDVWRLASLEDSAYVRIMGARTSSHIKMHDIYDAYGYNTMAMLLVGECRKVPANGAWLTLPHGLRDVCTGFEYNDKGVMTGWYTQRDAHQWPVHKKDTQYVEFFPGLGSAYPEIILGGIEHTLDQKLNYGFFICELWNGNAFTDWSYAIEDEHYAITDGVLTWLVDQEKFLVAIKSDRHVLVEQHDVINDNFVYRFDLSLQRSLTDGLSLGTIPQIPFGQIDVWLNGHPLVKDVDFVVQWPTVCIVNKKFLKDTKDQRITIRGTGLCRQDMSLEQSYDAGYISHGMMSYNHRFNIRDGKPIRIIANGRILHRDEVRWSEDRGMELPTVPNGSPYQVMDTILPLRLDEPIHDQFEFRKRSRLVDRQLADYLTNKIPEPQEPYPNPIPSKYPLYSPMMAMILFDVRRGIITPAQISRHLSDDEVYKLTEPYMDYMRFDPSFNDKIDTDYLSIHLHPLTTTVTLGIWEWRFIRTVNRVRFGSKLDMSGMLEIEAGYEYEYDIK